MHKKKKRMEKIKDSKNELNINISNETKKLLEQNSKLRDDLLKIINNHESTFKELKIILEETQLPNKSLYREPTDSDGFAFPRR